MRVVIGGLLLLIPIVCVVQMGSHGLIPVRRAERPWGGMWGATLVAILEIPMYVYYLKCQGRRPRFAQIVRFVVGTLIAGLLFFGIH